MGVNNRHIDTVWFYSYFCVVPDLIGLKFREMILEVASSKPINERNKSLG